MYTYYRKHTFNPNQFLKGLSITIVTLILIISILSASGNFISSANKVQHTIEYKVKYGDTLWNIAKEHYSGTGDFREHVYQISKINAIKNAQIYPGQLLKIPVER